MLMPHYMHYISLCEQAMAQVIVIELCHSVLNVPT